MQDIINTGAAESYVLQSSIAVVFRQMLVFEKAVVLASLVLKFSLVFAEYVHANRVVVVFGYWVKQLRTTSVY